MIIDELRRLKTHPTADELFGIVRKKMQRISLGTVYRNLMQLSDDGLIRKIEVDASKMRFDGDVGEHSHMRCRVCGRVYDIYVPDIKEIRSAMPLIKGHDVESYYLEFEGVCKDCKRKKPVGKGGEEREDGYQRHKDRA